MRELLAASSPVDRADVYPISGTPEPRAPRAPVPAAVKWLNDELDEIQSLSARYPAAALCAQVDNSHQQSIAALRRMSSQSTKTAVKLAAQESIVTNEDEWAKTESDALTHLVNTMDILGVAFPWPIVGNVPAHATVTIQTTTVDLLAIRGASHEMCIEHSQSFLTNAPRQVLLVSRDPDNTPWLKRFGSFLQPQSPKLGQERNFTDPASGSLHLGYQNLLNMFRTATAPAGIAGGVNAELTA